MRCWNPSNLDHGLLCRCYASCCKSCIPAHQGPENEESTALFQFTHCRLKHRECLCSKNMNVPPSPQLLPVLVLRSSVGNVCLGLCSLACCRQWCGINKRETTSNYKMQFICGRMEHHTSWFALFHCGFYFSQPKTPPQCNQLNGSLRQLHLFTLSRKTITCIKASTFCFATSPHRFGCLLEQGEDIFQP